MYMLFFHHYCLWGAPSGRDCASPTLFPRSSVQRQKRLAVSSLRPCCSLVWTRLTSPYDPCANWGRIKPRRQHAKVLCQIRSGSQSLAADCCGDARRCSKTHLRSQTMASCGAVQSVQLVWRWQRRGYGRGGVYRRSVHRNPSWWGGRSRPFGHRNRS